MEGIPLRGEGQGVNVVNKSTKVSHTKQYGIGIVIGLAIGIVICVGIYYGALRNCTEPTEPVDPNDSNLSPSENSDKEGLAIAYKTAAVASDAGPCSEIGAKKLRQGGAVVDAAIATMICCGIYNPQSAGIGGGSFMSIYNASTGQTIFIDSRETAPLKATRDMYGGDGYISQTGSLAIAVPGEVAGYWEAHQRYGKLPWASLFEESIELAEKGIRVSPSLARDIKKEEKYIRNSTLNLKPIFMNADETLKKEGDIVVRKAFANTLRAIADDGYDGFYRGNLAARIIADIDDAVEESIITLDDLEQYTLDVRPLLNLTLGNMTIYSPPTPSSGAVLTLILNILKGYNFTPDDLKTKQKRILSYHRIVEAFKHAYAHRSKLGDDRSENITQLIEKMVSPEYGEELRKTISDDTTRNSTEYGGDFSFDSGTSHISVVGSDGSAVSATSTINLRFGSKVLGYRTGIIFNNEMDDFSSPSVTNYFGLPPSKANFISPGKRPMSSMVPTIVLRQGSRRPALVTGASGGTKITTGTALVIMQSLWFGKSLQDATDDKRIHHQLYPEYVSCEEGFEEDVVDGLRKKGHDVRLFRPPGSVVQTIKSNSDEGSLIAISDKRKGGYTDGY